MSDIQRNEAPAKKLTAAQRLRMTVAAGKAAIAWANDTGCCHFCGRGMEPAEGSDFRCCGGTDENPREHCADCPTNQHDEECPLEPLNGARA